MTEWVYVCPDCAMWSANAELPDDDPNLSDQENAYRCDEIRNGTPVIVDCGGDADHCVGFSTQPCAACHTWMAGARHRAVLCDVPYANTGDTR